MCEIHKNKDKIVEPQAGSPAILYLPSPKCTVTFEQESSPFQQRPFVERKATLQMSCDPRHMRMCCHIVKKSELKKVPI